MAIMQSSLPYDMDALEPHVSKHTMSCHYDGHHRGYVEKLNALIEGTAYEDLSLEEIIARARKVANIEVLNNAAQIWNHAFFWKSMSPNGGQEPEGTVRNLIESGYRNITDFKSQFRQAASDQFGSGWAWLVLDKGAIRIISTGNAESPVGTDIVPLLTLDVWEHAYYLDYQNRRKQYVEAFLDHLVDWDFAQANLKAANVEQVA